MLNGRAIFPGQRQDCKSVQELWKAWDWPKVKSVVADKGYDNGVIREFLRKKNMQAIIPSKYIWAPKDSKLKPEDFYDVKIYRKRHTTERFSWKVKGK